MEYSLYTLNQRIKNTTLTVKEIINTLNLIGFEVDGVFVEEAITSPFITNQRLLIKIPANREDLFNESFLLKELSLLFLFEIAEIWNDLKKNYQFLIEKEYLKTTRISSETFLSPFSDSLLYKIDFTLPSAKESPFWIKTKLKNHGVESKNILIDILNLVFTEFGITFGLSFSSLTETTQKGWKVDLLTSPEPFQNGLNQMVTLPERSVVLKNAANQIVTVFSTTQVFIEQEIIGEQLKNLLNRGQEGKQEMEKFSLTFIFNPIFEEKNGGVSPDFKKILPFLRKSFTENLRIAFQRILTLLEITAEATLIQISSSKGKVPTLKTHKNLTLEKSLLKKLLNVDCYDTKVFQKAGLKLASEDNSNLYFDIPTSRRDLERDIDLIEEYSRFIGYKNFQEILPTKTNYSNNKQLKAVEFITSFFLNYGFTEVFTNSVQENKQQKNQLELTNPLNQDFCSLRTSMFPGLVNIFEINLKLGSSHLNFFEIGRVFKKVENKIIEQDKLTGIFQFTLLRDTTQLSFNWLVVKGFFEMFLSSFGYSELSFEQSKKTSVYFHPTRSVTIKHDNKILGRFGELNPRIPSLESSKLPIYIFDFNLSHFKNYRMKHEIRVAKEYSKYPSITKDLSFSINKHENVTNLKTYIQTSTKMLKNLEFFDVYIDPEKVDEKVNIAIRLEFQSATETLTNEFIEKEIVLLKKGMTQVFEIQFNE